MNRDLSGISHVLDRRRHHGSTIRGLWMPRRDEREKKPHEEILDILHESAVRGNAEDMREIEACEASGDVVYTRRVRIVVVVVVMRTFWTVFIAVGIGSRRSLAFVHFIDLGENTRNVSVFSSQRKTNELAVIQRRTAEQNINVQVRNERKQRQHQHTVVRRVLANDEQHERHLHREAQVEQRQDLTSHLNNHRITACRCSSGWRDSRSTWETGSHPSSSGSHWMRASWMVHRIVRLWVVQPHAKVVSILRVVSERMRLAERHLLLLLLWVRSSRDRLCASRLDSTWSMLAVVLLRSDRFVMGL